MKILYQVCMIGMLLGVHKSFGMLAALKAAAAKEHHEGAASHAPTAEHGAAPKTSANSHVEKDTTPSGSTNPMLAAMHNAAAKSTTASSKESSENKSITSKATEKIAATPTLMVTDVQSSSGLDTIDIDTGGNWLEKRIWFKKGEDLFDEIRHVVKKASDIRMEFVHEVNTIGKKIDEFYEHVNYDKGQIDQLLKDIQNDLSQAEQARGNDLSPKERSAKVTIKNEQKQVESIGKDIKKVDDFDNQIDKTMMQAFKIIDECRTLESNAWNNFKAIGTELDDKKARTLYYEIDNAYQNIQQKIQHLQSTLLPFLKNKLISPAEQVISKINGAIKSLQEKGVNLEAMVKGEEKDDEKTIKERQEEKEKEVEEKWKKHYQEKAEQKEKSADEHKEQVAKEKEDQAKKAKESLWYYRFAQALLAFMRAIFCWVNAICKEIFCHVMIYASALWKKVFDISPAFFETVKGFLHCAFCHILGFVFSVGDALRCIVCHILTWLSEFFK